MIGNWPSVPSRRSSASGGPLQHEAEDRHEHQQQREQRHERVVGDQRRAGPPGLRRTSCDRRDEAEPRLRCWRRSTCTSSRRGPKLEGGLRAGAATSPCVYPKSALRSELVAPLTTCPELASRPRDPGEEVALVRTKRRLLLRPTAAGCAARTSRTASARRRSSCWPAPRGRASPSRAHIANALEQKFLSRIHDRRRALAGRSAIEAALAGASDRRPEEAASRSRTRARRRAARAACARNCAAAALARLTDDQRLVLAGQVARHGLRRVLPHHGWSRRSTARSPSAPRRPAASC